jgi:hypothetical protein
MLFAPMATLWALMGMSPKMTPCEIAPLPIDPAVFNAMKNVQFFTQGVGEHSTIVETVLFKNGDILRIGASPNSCSPIHIIYARYWTYHPVSQDDSLKKSTFVTDLLFPTLEAEEIDLSMKESLRSWKVGAWDFEGQIGNHLNWSLIMDHPLKMDGMGQTISIQYVLPMRGNEHSP